MIAALVLSLAAAPPRHRPRPHSSAVAHVVVDVARGPVNTFRPDQALGAGVDGHSEGDAAAIYTPTNLAAMKSAGLLPLTYRLRTELGIEVWHWNPRGRWSDAAHHQGYWTSDDHAGEPILASYGYRLPRRGNTIDQANDDGWSRIDDGDTATFWKSNPYLDPHFTAGDGAGHDQWVLVDFGRRVPVGELRVLWGTPYAVRYRVQYWSGRFDPPQPDELPEGGRWRTFPRGVVENGSGGMTTLRLADAPVRARWLRIVLERGSGTAPARSADVRDGLGFAIRELWAGEVRGGRFADQVEHGASHAGQTIVYASSVDPWHREEDRDPETEQPGIDRVLRSGLTRGLPLLVPVGVLYDTPQNAAAELRFLRARGVPLRGIELGEEPDGQWVRPEDYAFLYLAVADSLRAIDRTVALGGPSLQTPYTGEMSAWTEGGPALGWMGRVIRYFRRKGRMNDFAFFSFEWYPWDETCAAPAPQLAASPRRLGAALDDLHRDGLPARLPAYISEYGWSAFSGPAEVSVEGALLNADIVGTFLARGGAAAYLYGYEPTNLERAENCDLWGNNMMFEAKGTAAPERTATYWGARMLTRDWAQPDSGASLPHAVYAADSDVRDAAGEPLVTAYAVRRPDGGWAVMMINKDPVRAHSVRATFRDTGGERTLGGPAELVQFGRAQYAWHAAGENGHPARSLPPARTTVRGGAIIVLPPFSLTVLRGRLD